MPGQHVGLHRGAEPARAAEPVDARGGVGERVGGLVRVLHQRRELRRGLGLAGGVAEPDRVPRAVGPSALRRRIQPDGVGLQQRQLHRLSRGRADVEHRADAGGDRGELPEATAGDGARTGGLLDLRRPLGQEPEQEQHDLEGGRGAAGGPRPGPAGRGRDRGGADDAHQQPDRRAGDGSGPGGDGDEHGGRFPRGFPCERDAERQRHGGAVRGDVDERAGGDPYDQRPGDERRRAGGHLRGREDPGARAVRRRAGGGAGPGGGGAVRLGRAGFGLPRRFRGERRREIPHDGGRGHFRGRGGQQRLRRGLDDGARMDELRAQRGQFRDVRDPDAGGRRGRRAASSGS